MYFYFNLFFLINIVTLTYIFKYLISAKNHLSTSVQKWLKEKKKHMLAYGVLLFWLV